MTENEYCIRIVGGRTNTPGCTDKWKGPPISVSRNGVLVGATQKGFAQEDFCIPLGQVDPENDIFEVSVENETGNGCISSISVDGVALMFGPNKDMFHYWSITLDAVNICQTPHSQLLDSGQPVKWGMHLKSFEFQNGQIISDECICKS